MTTDPQLLNLGAAAIIVFLMLDRVISLVKAAKERQAAPGPNRPGAIRCGYSPEYQQRQQALAIQIREVHETLRITKDFQSALSDLTDMLSQQNRVLQQVSSINQETLTVLKQLVNN